MKLDDRPIERIDDDKLRFGDLVRRIARRIREAAKNRPDMLGVFGPWGSGKTSLLNLISGELGDDVVWVDFDAQRYQAQGSILLPLLHKMAGRDESAKKNFWRLAKVLTLSLSDILLRTATKGMKLTDVENNFELAEKDDAAFPESPADTLRNGFEQLVKKLSGPSGKRVVVAIDNLDRCRPEGVLQAIETLHLITETACCTFLVVVDRDVLVSFINRQYEGTTFDGSRYLEKVFPDVFRIPDPRATTRYSPDATPDDDVLRYLQGLLEAPECANAREHLKLFWDVIGASSTLRNPRRVKRLVRRLCQIDETTDAVSFEYTFLLVVLNDVWPSAFEFLQTASEESWESYLKDANKLSDAGLREFLTAMVKRKRILDFDQVWQRLDVVRSLGL